MSAVPRPSGAPLGCDRSPTSSVRAAAEAVAAVAGRPHLWTVAIHQAARLAPRGWWRRPPFVPLPGVAYLRFRLVTAYGGDGSLASVAEEIDAAADVVSYLEWCRQWPMVAGSTHRSR